MFKKLLTGLAMMSLATQVFSAGRAENVTISAIKVVDNAVFIKLDGKVSDQPKCATNVAYPFALYTAGDISAKVIVLRSNEQRKQSNHYRLRKMCIH
ncbi:hypothetical protein IC617_08765 [Neiella sp. HB171785]|uniref:Uncharacterized protein n=1 Tax=Neiella litorisoli TaxID=2771431 RepID=A0A8J6QUU4_9GAMM|nr:hypothetical protein [Neiella litorisoli]MBD1389518.1 hypothetical protein [Neiella litorisoli]